MAKNKVTFAKVLGSVAKVLVTILQYLFLFLAKIIWKTGLVIPLVYLIFGGLLKLFAGFNPFDFSVESQLYIAGLCICVFCAFAMALKNLVKKPLKSFKEGYKEPVWKKKVEEEKEEKPRLLPVKKQKKVELLTPKKAPKRYFSAREKDTLIYEYEDRFEVFKYYNGEEIYIKTEYKDNF